MTTAAGPILHWLLNEAPCTEPVRLMGGLCERLVAAGVPVFRSRIALTVMHPELFALGLTWSPGTGAESAMVTRRFVDITAPKVTPIPLVMFSGHDEVRCRLDRGTPEFRTLAELAELGATDYVILRLPLSTGTSTFFSAATSAPGGFTDDQLELLRALVPALARVVEIATAAHESARLLEVYLGHNAAARVRAGSVRRGTGEVIRAAIWYCDLRGFTAIADTMPLPRLVTILDRYFECVSDAVADSGGEILKFIGDAMLGVFAVGDDSGEACARALVAAERALDAVAALGRDGTLPPLSIGIGLHLGDVMYGNIGGRERLDFTVIGAAVNEVTRVESLCRTLDTPLLATAGFAAKLGDTALVSLGRHALKGVAAPMEVLTLPRFARHAPS